MKNNPLLIDKSAPHHRFFEIISATLEAALEKDGWRFSMADQECSSEEVTAVDSLLPVWILRAHAMMNQSLGGKAPGISFEIDMNSPCRSKAKIPESGTASLEVWLLFLHATIEEWYFKPEHQKLIAEKKLVPLDPIYEEFNYAFENNLIVKVRSTFVPIRPTMAPVSRPNTNADQRNNE